MEKLLVLQDRDRSILRVKTELAKVGPERQLLQSKSKHTQEELESLRLQARHLESERKKLELDAEAKKQMIDRYSVQQFQTKKNEEYRALTHEIDTCRAGIRDLEDKELDLMEQGEEVQGKIHAVSQSANEIQRIIQSQLADIDAREQNLKKELAILESNREELASAVDEDVRARYERELKRRGDNVVVGVEHSACGGCHMRLPTQIIISCQGNKEIVTCSNCGRMLYFTRDMDLAPAD